MSRSVIACRCGRPLGDRHRTGRLNLRPGVTVPCVDPVGRLGPFVRMVCPACGAHRDYAVAAPPARASGDCPGGSRPAV